jgi:hypothetical protein
MTLIQHFALVVLNLAGELWTGLFNRSPDFYDKHSVTKSKAGYAVFVTLAALAAVGIAFWLSGKIY